LDQKGALGTKFALIIHNQPNYVLFYITVVSSYHTTYAPFGSVISSTGTGQRTGYIGREADNETGLGNYGVRLYEPEYGRFMSVDVLWGEYEGWQPYQYALNAPLSFRDFSGLEIDLSSMMLDVNGARYSDELISELQVVTGLKSLKLDEKYRLVYNQEEVSDIGSIKARDFLKGLISSKEVIAVGTSENGSKADLDEFVLDFAQIQDFKDGAMGGLNPLTMGIAMTFLHEALHTTVGGELDDDISGYGKIGAVESFMNEIRSELGVEYGQRLSYRSVRDEYGFQLIPFSLITIEAIGRGKEPTRGMYIKSRSTEN